MENSESDLRIVAPSMPSTQLRRNKLISVYLPGWPWCQRLLALAETPIHPVCSRNRLGAAITKRVLLDSDRVFLRLAMRYR